MMRLVALYAQRILQGAQASELPVEQLSKYELIINVGIARELGITIPNEVLLRADQVIR